MSAEPSNTEIMTLLRELSASADRRESASITRNTELRTLVVSQGTQIASLHERVGRVELKATAAHDKASEASDAARKALDSQSELEGALLAEVGKLALNDKAQNAALVVIGAESKVQTGTLSDLVKSETKRAAREDVIYWAITKGIPLLWAASLALGGAWLATQH